MEVDAFSVIEYMCSMDTPSPSESVWERFKSNVNNKLAQCPEEVRESQFDFFANEILKSLLSSGRDNLEYPWAPVRMRLKNELQL